MIENEERNKMMVGIELERKQKRITELKEEAKRLGEDARTNLERGHLNMSAQYAEKMAVATREAHILEGELNSMKELLSYLAG